MQVATRNFTPQNRVFVGVNAKGVLINTDLYYANQPPNEVHTRRQVVPRTAIDTPRVRLKWFDQAERKGFLLAGINKVRAEQQVQGGKSECFQ